MQRNHAARIQGKARGSRSRVACEIAGWLLPVLFVFSLHCSIEVAFGGDNIVLSEPARGTSKIRILRSQHLILHTDLDRYEARKFLKRLNVKLREIASYWSRSANNPIRCYIVHDLNAWNANDLDDPYARAVIQRVGGFATRHPGGAKMYARSSLDVALHEIVHAYCLEAFPNSGPDWYKEGMACLLATNDANEAGIQADETVIDYLRTTEHRSARSIVEGREFTSPIANIIQSAVDRVASDQIDTAIEGEAIPGETKMVSKAFTKNTAKEQKLLDTANGSYRWSWALCYFLENNENYQDQFRELGKKYLTGARPRFDKVFLGNDEQLESEFKHFVRHLASGYRVDLCRWNWEDASKSITTRATMTRVAARRGLQSTKLSVAKGSQYAFETDGLWSVKSTGPKTSAEGNDAGGGRLLATVLNNTEMGATMDLSADGIFTANESGTLFLRCSDDWHEIGDNRGCIRVTIRQLQNEKP